MTGYRNRREAARSTPGGPYLIIKAMVGREPDSGVLERIDRVRSALNARDDDAIWVVLGIFESAIDRAQRGYKAYVHCLLLVFLLEIVVQIGSIYVSEARMRSDETAMRTSVGTAIQQAACGGIGDQDACEVARINAATPARRAVSGVISRLPDDLINALASTPSLDQWLAWMSRSQATAAAQNVQASKEGKTRDAH